MKILLLFTSLLVGLVTVSAQSFRRKSDFIEYLLRKELYEEATLEVESIKGLFAKSLSVQDSLNYFLGKSYFMKNKDSSIFYFNKVNNLSLEVFNKSRIFSAFLNFEKQKYLECDKQLSVLDDEYSCFTGMMKYSSGIMQVKPMELEASEDCLDLSYEYEMLKGYKDDLRRVRNRSPFLGGLFSAVIPGLGKIYAGKPKQGLAFFITLSLLGYQAYEGYRIGGGNDYRFIAFGSLFSVFYVGNIWGSALSVKITKQEIYEETHNNIIATMRIPVIGIFKGN